MLQRRPQDVLPCLGMVRGVGHKTYRTVGNKREIVK
jgi:hypothetical protein